MCVEKGACGYNVKNYIFGNLWVFTLLLVVLIILYYEPFEPCFDIAGRGSLRQRSTTSLQGLTRSLQRSIRWLQRSARSSWVSSQGLTRSLQFWRSMKSNAFPFYGLVGWGGGKTVCVIIH